MKIIPEEIPNDAQALTQDSQISDTSCLGRAIADLNGKNVFVNLTNDKSLVGRLECDKGCFTVGRTDQWFSYDQISSFREV